MNGSSRWTYSDADLLTSVPARFQQVLEHLPPNQLAFVSADEKLTYHELAAASRGLAAALVGVLGGVAARAEQKAVALLLPHDATALIGILGVLEAGHFYIPLDFTMGEAMLRQILLDCPPQAIVTTTGLQERLQPLLPTDQNPPVLCLDALPSNRTPPPVAPPCDGQMVAYVQYTSGSTGRPRGVVSTHALNMFASYLACHDMDFAPGSRVAHLRSYAYGASTQPIFGGLLNGATLYAHAAQETTPSALYQWITAWEITHLHVSLGMLRGLADLAETHGPLRSLRVLVHGGETIYRTDVERLYRLLPDTGKIVTRLVSTEASVFARLVIESGAALPDSRIPAGYAPPHIAVSILGEDDQPVDAEQVGQMAVRSRFLAAGYWQRPEDTAARFLPDPDGGDRRIFLTGEIGRFRADGCLEFVGRKDLMVKIRGYRVEPEAVEAALQAQTGVRDCVVVAQPSRSGELRLIAYVAMSRTPGASVSDLRRSLHQTLPDYMIPARFVFVDRLARKVNGKVDRQALPPPGAARPVLDTIIVAPRTEPERQVAAIWADLLELDEVGVEDNFFELGGDSILAMRMMLAFERQLGCTVPKDFFGQPTVARLARQVAAAVGPVAVNPPAISAETPTRVAASPTHQTRPSPRSAYDNDALRQQYLFWRGHMPPEEILPSVKGLLPPESLVLDVGCGDGRMAMALAPFARQVIGIDLSPAMVALATRRRAAAGAGNVTFLVGDSANLPYPPGAFDLAVSMYSLEHVDVAEVLLRLGQLLRPGGWLLVTEPLAPPRGWPPSLWMRWMTLRQAPALARQSGMRAAWQIMRFRLGQTWVHHQVEDACWSLAQWQAVAQRSLPGAVLSRATTGDAVILLWQRPGDGGNRHAAEEQSLTTDSDALVRERVDDMLQRDPQAAIVAANHPDASIESRSPMFQAAAEPLRQPHRRRPWRARVNARLRRFMERGPLRGDRAFLPYGIGIRMQRALVAQPAVQRLFARELDALDRWQAELGAPHDEQTRRISLLANTWLWWRQRSLVDPDVLARWVIVSGAGWSSVERMSPPCGVVLVVPHVGTSIVPLEQVLRLRGRETARVVTDRSLQRTGDRAAWEAQQTPARTAQLWQARQVLQRGGVVLIAGDGLGGQRTVDVPFWGRRWPFQVGAAALAIETDALFAPVWVTFDAASRVHMEVAAPLAAHAAPQEERTAELTRQYGQLYAARWPQFYASVRWQYLTYALELPAA